jgi:hypothetical protein
MSRLAMTPAQTTIRSRWPAEFDGGARCGCLREYPGEREPGGYPKGFHQWPLDRRNAWWGGFNFGRQDRLRGRR